MKLSFITICFLAVVGISPAAAQSLDLFGGLNLSGMKHKFNGATQESKMSTSYQLGLGLVVPFAKDNDPTEMQGIYPSLQFIRKGLKKTTLIDPINSDLKLNYLQLTIPLYGRYGLYGIGLGPYAAIATGGKTAYTSIAGGDRKINFGNGTGDDLKGLDYGLSLTMSINIFYFQYDWGITNLGTGKYGTAKNRNFNFGLLIPLVTN